MCPFNFGCIDSKCEAKCSEYPLIKKKLHDDRCYCGTNLCNKNEFCQSGTCTALPENMCQLDTVTESSCNCKNIVICENGSACEGEQDRCSVQCPEFPQAYGGRHRCFCAKDNLCLTGI